MRIREFTSAIFKADGQLIHVYTAMNMPVT